MITVERPATSEPYVLEASRTSDELDARIRVEVVREPVAFAALRAEWGHLLDESGAAVFNSWEWLYSWHRHLGSHRQLYILVAREHGSKLVGLMPLCVEHRRALGLKVRRLAFLGETHVCGDYMDILSLPEMHAAVVRAFASYLKHAHNEWDVLDLTDIDSQSPTLSVLQRHFPASRYSSEVRPGSVCPIITFEPQTTFEGFLKGSSRRENYKRRRKQLEKQPGFSVECIEDPARLAGPFNEFLHLHASRWATDGGSDGIEGQEVEAFHREAATLLAERGKVRLFMLRVDGKPVASLYALRHGDSMSYYQAGRDPEWQHMSVGLVMLVETFKRAIEEGVATYDFLRGEEPYKADWNNGWRTTSGLRIYSRNGRGGLLGKQEQIEQSARRLAKKALPATFVDALRRKRQT